MAPEQLSGGAVDRRADVFGAAVVFWEMLTGQRLFDGADEGEIYGKVLRGDVRRPSKVVQVGRPQDRRDRPAGPRTQRRSRATSPRARWRSPSRTTLPLATPSQVGQWVERLTGDALAERRRQIAEIERDGEGDEGGTSIRLSRPPDPAVNIADGAG